MLSQELLFALARHKDADVTVAVGDIFIDVCAVTYDHGRDKYVLHLMADDLADALRTLGDDPEPQADVGAEERGIAGHAAE